MHRSCEHADHLINRFARCHANAFNARRRDAKQCELAIDLRAATVDKNDAARVRMMQRNEARKRARVLRSRVDKRAADFDDERSASRSSDFNRLIEVGNVFHASPPMSAAAERAPA